MDGSIHHIVKYHILNDADAAHYVFNNSVVALCWPSSETVTKRPLPVFLFLASTIGLKQKGQSLNYDLSIVIFL